MNKFNFIFFLSLLSLTAGQLWATTPSWSDSTGTTVGPTAPNDVERECACTHSKIWLDIVAVIDNSLTMTQEGISQIQATLLTVVHDLNLSPSGGWASRIGIVSFNDVATVVADLTTFSNADDFGTKLYSIRASTSVRGVNILSGLQTASNLLDTVTQGPNRRSVVILFTSAYNNNGYNDPLPMANSLISDNVKLITVSFSQRMTSSDVLKVSELAYPGFNLTNSQTDLIPTIFDKFCQANCFCRGNWMQYKTNFYDDKSRVYGLCLYYASIAAGWTPAKMSCQSEAQNAYLVTEFSSEKHSFNLAYVKNQSLNGNYEYHIGLSYVNGGYYWEQPSGQPKVPLSGYDNWNVHYPNTGAGVCVRNANIIGNIFGWTNENCWSANKLYICQTNSCDTDNYCS